MTHYYKIADLIIQMASFGQILTQAEPYRCEPAEPGIVIHSDWQAPQTPSFGERQLMMLLDKLLTNLPVWEMGCNMDPRRLWSPMRPCPAGERK